MNLLFRILLLVWVLGYVLVSCVPLFGDNLVVAGFGFLAGVVFLVPWLIGVLVLGILVWLTNPSRPR
ncbi:MAG TPA: hypothetical protein VH440_02895 [Candidatus Limnocylindrales bacterium]